MKDLFWLIVYGLFKCFEGICKSLLSFLEYNSYTFKKYVLGIYLPLSIVLILIMAVVCP